MVFELATGDFLFEPRAGRHYSRDEDHLAQMSELLGRVPRAVSGAGKRARDFFTRDGALRHIQRLHHWPLERVLAEKYRMPLPEVRLGCVGVGGVRGAWVWVWVESGERDCTVLDGWLLAGGSVHASIHCIRCIVTLAGQ